MTWGLFCFPILFGYPRSASASQPLSDLLDACFSTATSRCAFSEEFILLNIETRRLFATSATRSSGSCRDMTSRLYKLFIISLSPSRVPAAWISFVLLVGFILSATDRSHMGAGAETRADCRLNYGHPRRAKPCTGIILRKYSCGRTMRKEKSVSRRSEKYLLLQWTSPYVIFLGKLDSFQQAPGSTSLPGRHRPHPLGAPFGIPALQPCIPCRRRSGCAQRNSTHRRCRGGRTVGSSPQRLTVTSHTKKEESNEK